MPVAKFDQVVCNSLKIQNGKSVIIQLAAQKDAGIQINVIRRNEEGTLVNVMAIDVAQQGNPQIRITNPENGDLVFADITPIIPPEAEPLDG